MNHVFKFVLLALTSYLFALPATAKKTPAVYTMFDIQPEVVVTHNPLVLDLLPSPGNEIMLIGVKDEQRFFAVYHRALQEDGFELYQQYPIPNAIMAYDIFESELTTKKQVFFMSEQGIHRLDLEDMANPLPLLVEAKSIFIQKEVSHIVKRNFTRDFNQDDYADFYLQGFDHLITLVSQEQSLSSQKVGLGPQFTVYTSSIEMKQRELFFADFNMDGLEDIGWLTEGGIDFQPQIGTGFSQTAQRLVLNPEFSDQDWWDLRQADGSQIDQSDLKHRKIERIEDINGDDIPDLLVRFAQSSGVFDRTNDYEVFFGQQTDDQLVYASTPDTAIRSEGTLTGLTIVDLNQNNRKDILLSGFDIGVSQIIGALLSGAIDQDVYLYQQDEQGMFSKKPAVSKEVEMSFSLSSGQAGTPIVKVADINNDKRHDLLLSNGDDALSFYRGVEQQRLFNRRKLTIKTAVPQNGESSELADIDQNGTEEIVLRFGKQDGDMNNTIRVISLL